MRNEDFLKKSYIELQRNFEFDGKRYPKNQFLRDYDSFRTTSVKAKRPGQLSWPSIVSEGGTPRTIESTTTPVKSGATLELFFDLDRYLETKKH